MHHQVLVSSGDDGWLHTWDIGAWGTDGSALKPQYSFDLNAWVVKELKGQIVKVRRSPTSTQVLTVR